MTVEQVVAANKANVETLFGLTNKAFEGVERLVELNLQVAKAALSEVAEGTKAALSVKDAQELLSLQAGMLQPSAEKAVAYGRHVYDIAATTNAEVGKVAETQMAEMQKKFLSGVDSAIRTRRLAPRAPCRWSSRPSPLRTTPTRACKRLPGKPRRSRMPTSKR